MDFFEMKEKQYISHKGNIHVSVCLSITSPVTSVIFTIQNLQLPS
jgi:hypothetical protein